MSDTVIEEARREEALCVLQAVSRLVQDHAPPEVLGEDARDALDRGLEELGVERGLDPLDYLGSPVPGCAGECDGGSLCAAGDGPYVCTRHAGHDGPHEACGMGDGPRSHPVHRWRDDHR